MTAAEPHFGIPDPGRASKAVAIVAAGASPFDAIRHLTPEGREYWSARELMPLLGYEKWERFADAIGRAKIAAHNAGYVVAEQFPGAGKMIEAGNGAQRRVDDYHLSRYACYLIALNGDPRKDEIAQAQTYFVIKTREAEVAAVPLSEDEIVHQALAITARRVQELKAQVAELQPPAAAWQELADASGDYSVADAAKVLSRDPQINIKERALFAYMAGLDWVFKREGRWKAKRAQLDTGRLAEKVGKPFWHAGREEMVAGDATVRVTPKGLQELHKRLGGGGQLALEVAS